MGTVISRNFGKRLVLTLMSLAIVSALQAIIATDLAAKSHEESPTPDKVAKNMHSLSMPFVANQGQVHEDVLYYAKTFGGTLFVTTKGELVYSLPKNEGGNDLVQHKKELADLEKINRKTSIGVIKECLVNGEVEAIEGVEASETKISYFAGDDSSQYRGGIPTYGVVSLGEVYPGVEMRLKAYGNNVEKLFYVAPGGETSSIALRVEGGNLMVNDQGELEVETKLGAVKFTKPVAYQEIEGKRVDVAVSYQILEGGSAYGFLVGKYDSAHVLVIDPLLAATVFSSDGYPYAIALDENGNVYVAGAVSSAFFTVTPGVYDSSQNGNTDVFVSKLNGELTQLLASTFMGGSAFEWTKTLALDGSGNVVLAGRTASADFPTTPGAYHTDFNGSVDIFVTKLSGDLTHLLASSRFGGNRWDDAVALVLDKSGDVFVTGGTDSNIFPLTSGAYDSSIWSDYTDAFVAKLNGDLTQLLASTFLGGRLTERVYAICLDGNGNVLVAGTTDSLDFPVTLGAYRVSRVGSEGFVSKLSSDLSQVLASTFLDVNVLWESIQALSLDNGGNVYVVGQTRRQLGQFSGGYDSTINGYTDVIVSKLNGDLTQLLASTFLGGKSFDRSSDMTLDDSGNVYVVGYFDYVGFPVTSGAFDTSANGGSDGFLSMLSGNLSQLLYSTVLGGGGSDFIFAVTVDGSGNVYVAGVSQSGAFPVTQGSRSWGPFVAKFSTGVLPSANAGPDQTVDCAGPGGVLVTLDGSASVGAKNFSWAGPFVTVTGVNPSVMIPFGTHTITLTVDDGMGKIATDTVVIDVQDAVAPSLAYTFAGSVGNNSWYVSAVTVNLIPGDVCSGVKEIRYSIDNANQSVVNGDSATFAVTMDGTHSITYLAMDGAGNTMTTEIAVNIDQSPPVIVITGVVDGATYELGLANPSYNVTDTLSGVASHSASLSGGAQVFGDFVYTVSAADNAGNISTANVSYKVVATPAGTVTLIENMLASGLIDQQTASQLITTLDSALASYSGGNSMAGDNKMGAFVNKVSAPGQGLPSDVVVTLVNAANYIINNN